MLTDHVLYIPCLVASVHWMHAVATTNGTHCSQSLTTNPPSSSSGLILTLSQDLIFEFDLNGWVVVRNVITAEEVAAANAAIDTHAAELHERRNPGLRNTKAGTVLHLAMCC